MTLVNSGTLEANGGELDITNEPVTNTGTLQAIDDSTLKLTSTTVTNSGGKVTVESGSTLDLVGAAIDGGTLGNSGTLDSTGSSALADVGMTNSGTLEAIDDSTLELTSTTVANSGGTVTVESGSTLDLMDTTITRWHVRQFRQAPFDRHQRAYRCRHHQHRPDRGDQRCSDHRSRRGRDPDQFRHPGSQWRRTRYHQ